MKGFKKCMSAVTAAALMFTALPANGLTTVYADVGGDAETADEVVTLSLDDVSTFNDTDGDGLGEFEGWGTSLCWWANRLGYSETLTQKAAKAFYSSEGLNMNIGRYNVGGGDLVGEVPTVPINEKALIYDVTDTANDKVSLSYAGSKMEVEASSKFNSAVWSKSDADFGITRGSAVNSISSIGWITEMGGAADTQGDNLHFTVDAAETANYTIKMLLTLEGTQNRGVGMRVNNDTSTDQKLDAAAVNSDIIASGSSTNYIYRVEFSDVPLQQGDNTLLVGGNGGWGLNFIRMAIVKSGEEGVLSVEDEYMHAPHIQRSDSAVPGYCTDVVKMDLTKKTLADYQKEYARADETSGYAWNYDWTADQNQWNVLQAAMAAHDGTDSTDSTDSTDFLAEAFSNSPPYFMTNSGCSSGAVNANTNNLRDDCYEAFAGYMADVVVHWAEVKASGVNDGVYFQSTTPMNEPYTNYWGANSAKQEGCHFDQGESESKIIVAYYKELQKQAAAMQEGAAKDAVNNIIVSGTDETSIDTQITSYNKLSEEAKKAIKRIDTHTYSGSNRKGLRTLAETAGKNLWMSEIDGANLAGTNAGEMAAGLGLAQRMITDLNELRSSAWILWNAIDINIDSDNPFDANSLEELKTKTNDDGTIMYDPEKYGYWGIAIADHDNKNLILTRKYYAYGQFSKYICPGYTIIGTDKASKTVAAYDPVGEQVVIVALNTSASDQTWKFDLGGFDSMGNQITAVRTSGATEGGEDWVDVTNAVNISADTTAQTFTSTLKGNSITTFTIKGVDLNTSSIQEKNLIDGMKAEIAESMELEVSEIPLNSSMVTGSVPYNNSQTDTVDKVVDGDYDTFFDGVSDGWVQIDLGDGNAKKIGALGYAPRSGYVNRAVGASFYGSNDGTTWTLLYTILEAPEAGTITRATPIYETMKQSYRYIKYAVPAGDESYACNIAEIKLYELTGELGTLPETVSEWIAYCEENVEDATAGYNQDKYNAYTAAKEAAQSCSAISPEAPEASSAIAALIKAYKNLKEKEDQLISVSNTLFLKKVNDAAFDLGASVTKGNGALSYESSNTEVATVSDTGQVTLVGTGSATITIKAAGTAGYNEKTLDVVVRVDLSDQVIEVSETAYTKKIGDDAFNLGAELTTGDGVLSYSSSNQNVAEVSNEGLVTIKGAGTATITITASATQNYSVKSIDITLTVARNTQTITVAHTSYAKKVGDAAFDLNATTNGDGALSYDSSDTDVAEVSEDGMVTVKAVGTTTITITAAETEAYDKGIATVTITVNSGGSSGKLSQTISVPQDSYTKTVGDEKFNLNAVTNGDGTLSYESSDTDVAEVSEDGLVTIKAAGTTTITITAAETESYDKGTTEVTITVNPEGSGEKSSQTISGPQTSYTKTVGDAAFNLNAKTSGDGALSYGSSNTAVAEVSANGQVTIKAAGATTITITAAETEKFNKASLEVKITVNPSTNGTPNQSATKEEQVISVQASYTKTYGNKAFSLNAKLTTGNGSLSYKSSDTKVASVTNNGKVTLKAPGYAVITITAAATEKYNEKSATVALRVNPKKVTVSGVKSQSGKKLKVSWKKDATVTGYEVQASLKKNFKKIAKKATIKKAKTVSTTLKGLTKGKKYYVRVRSYKTVKINGKSTKLYSAWTVKTSKKVK